MGSWGTTYNNTMFGVRYHTQNMMRLQEQITTGSRVIRASDEPTNAHRIMTLQDSAKTLEDYNSNLGEIELSLSEGSNAIQSMSELFARVDVLVAQASNGTYMVENREAIAEEIDQILEQCVSLANHKVMGRYVFGGQNSFTPPYEVTRQGGRIVDLQYRGSYSDQPVAVGPGVTMSGQLVGERFFRNHRREAPEIYGATGAAIGAGTSNLRGDHWLRLTHDTTAYQAGSGVTTGDHGDSRDTILGAGHAVTLDTAAQTIRLDNGTSVTYTGAETDLKLTNEDGDVVYVNVTGALADGTWTTQSNGKVALDDGTPVALNFAAENFSVADPTDPSRFVYVKTNDIERVGVDSITVPGTYDVFNTLVQARDLMRNTENLETSAQLEHITRIGDAVVEIGNGFRQRITIIGGRLGAADTLRKTLDELKFHTDTEATSLQQADIVEVATQLARSETLYQMSLQVAAKTMSLTLLDYMH